MGNILFIVWRESLEAVLVIGILSSFLKRSRARKQVLHAMWFGVAGGVALSAALALVTLGVQDSLSGRKLDFFQAGSFLFSAVLMTQMVFWMNRHGRAMKKELETGMAGAVKASGAWGAALVALLAVAREGSETVVYLYSLMVENSGTSMASLWTAALGGLALAFATAWAVGQGIRMLNYGTFFKVTSFVLLLSAAGLVVSGTAKLIEIDWLPAIKDPLWNTSWLLDAQGGVGHFVALFTGYRPRPAAMIVVAYALYWTLVAGGMKWAQHRAASAPQGGHYAV